MTNGLDDDLTSEPPEGWEYDLRKVQTFAGVKFFEASSDASPELRGELAKAREKIRRWTENNSKQKRCFLCGKPEIIGSHVIKNETLKSISCDGKLLTLNNQENSFYSVLTEDRHYIAAKKAFVFNLICHSCDSNFSYENKAKVKISYSKIELESIALKVRLKELHDNNERLSVLKCNPSSDVERIMISNLGNKKRIEIGIAEEEREIRRIHRGIKSYTAFTDDFLNFRIPFAMESFIAPRVFPRSREIILNNDQMGRNPHTKNPISGFYVVLQPSSNHLDNWSRLTIFYDEADEIMIDWFKRLPMTSKIDTEHLANLMVSHHININSKNFAMSPKINEKFLTEARYARYQPRLAEPAFWRNWIKIL